MIVDAVVLLAVWSHGDLTTALEPVMKLQPVLVFTSGF